MACDVRLYCYNLSEARFVLRERTEDLCPITKKSQGGAHTISKRCGIVPIDVEIGGAALLALSR